jgi:hypothetical protein
MLNPYIDVSHATTIAQRSLIDDRNMSQLLSNVPVEIHEYFQGDLGPPGPGGQKGEKGEKGSLGRRGTQVCICLNVFVFSL